MQSTIQTILDELYALEPALREKEDAIIRIIEKMQESRPSIEIDEAFKAELREKVLSEISVRHPDEGRIQDRNHRSSGFFAGSEGRKSWNWGWIFAGLSTTAFASFAIYTLFGGFAFQTIPPEKSDKPLASVTSSSRLSFAPNITKIAVNNAYGSNLALSTNNMGVTQQLGTREAMSSIAPVGQGGGGMATGNAKMMASDAMTMPAFDYPYYTYVYTGALPVAPGDLTVYKRNPSGFTSTETASFLSSFTLDGMNLGAFENKSLTNLSFVENRDFGYSVMLDFQNGNVGIYQNWEKWPQVKCDKNGCEQPPEITEKDVPSDEEFVRIGDEFLAKYGIDRSLYGAPKVDGSWRIMYARAMKENTETYIPDQYTVTYPLTFEGKKLYEEYGGYKGITLTVDIRAKRVTSMYSLEKQNLTSSAYTTPTTEDNFRQILKYGGRYETKPYGEQKTVEISLGEPTLQYVHIYGEWKDGKSDEYYVPAYVFPVLNKPEASHLQDAVIVPAVADFATFNNMTEGHGSVAVPMPALMEKAAQ